MPGSLGGSGVAVMIDDLFAAVGGFAQFSFSHQTLGPGIETLGEFGSLSAVAFGPLPADLRIGFDAQTELLGFTSDARRAVSGLYLLAEIERIQRLARGEQAASVLQIAPAGRFKLFERL